jgi:hypothetical protein
MVPNGQFQEKRLCFYAHPILAAYLGNLPSHQNNDLLDSGVTDVRNGPAALEAKDYYEPYLQGPSS